MCLSIERVNLFSVEGQSLNVGESSLINVEDFGERVVSIRSELTTSIADFEAGLVSKIMGVSYKSGLHLLTNIVVSRERGRSIQK
jgi:hypothetical protein